MYVESSALLKLVFEERESSALREWLRTAPREVSSELARLELARAVLGRGAARAVARRAQVVIEDLSLVRVDPDILRRAALIPPARLRTLDAIHVATALSIPGLTGIVTYDTRVTEASNLAGLSVFAPGL